MSIQGRNGVSIPVCLFHESEGTVVTVELKSGDSFRGRVASAEDSMNMCLSGVTHTDITGRTTEMENVFLRGSKILFVSLPELLRHSV